MDVNSPAAADTISRPSPPSAEPSRVTTALRRTGVAVAGVGVAALTAAACVLSFEDLRGLAVAGEAPPGLAYLYPAAFDALLVIALIAMVLLRGGGRPARLQAAAVLTLLFAGAVAVEVTTALRVTVDVRRAAIVVAVVPWVALVLALWLWFLLIGHTTGRRAAAGATVARPGDDIVPFSEPRSPAAGHPVGPDYAVPPPLLATPDPPVPRGPAETAPDQHAEPPEEPASRDDLPAAASTSGPAPAPWEADAAEVPETSPRTEPDRPMRWGDLLRPPQGDVLVHPPRGAVRQDAAPRSRTGDGDRKADRHPAQTSPAPSDEAEAEVHDRGADTQPMGVIAERPAAPAGNERRGAGPDGDRAGKAAEESDAQAEVPDDEGPEGSPPPFGRLRSTPTPPEG